MLGIIFIVIASIFVFKTARQNGYNPWLWTLAAIAVFFGIQFLVGIAYGMVVFLVAREEALETITGTSIMLTIATSIVSIIGVLLILKKVNTIKDDDQSDPPPPGMFDLK